MPDNYIQITVSNYFNVACGTCAPGYFNVNTYQASDDFTINKGKHQIGFGFDGRKQQFNSLNNQQANGQWTFAGSSTVNTGDSLADLELGKLAGLTDGNALSDYIRQTVFAFYVQDTFRATSHLTINAGARWEPYQPAFDKQCRGNQFSLAEYLAGYHSSQYPAAPAGLLFGQDAPNHNGCGFANSHWADVSPRLGLVWDPKGEGKQTIRAGFGLLHDNLELFYPERWTTNPPYASSIALGTNSDHSRIRTSVTYRPRASLAIRSPVRQSSRLKALTLRFHRTYRWNTFCSGISVINVNWRRTGW